jgi:signal transduction histidine kinase
VTPPFSDLRVASRPRIPGPRKPLGSSSDVLTLIPILTAVTSVGYRLVTTMASLVPWLWMPSTHGFGLAALLVVVMISNLVTIRLLWCRLVNGGQVGLALLLADTCVSIAIFMGIKMLMTPPSAVLLGIVVPAGTVAFWTSSRGWVAGLLGAAGSVPIALLTGWMSSGPISPWVFALAAFGHCLAAVGVVVAFQRTLAEAVRVSGAAGFDTGEQTERTRSRRIVHDTALQTLEAIALTASSPPGPDAERVLRRTGEMAASQARQLRSDLEDADEQVPSVLVALGSMLAFGRRHGLNVHLAADATDLPVVDADSVTALVGAMREALLNVSKHADTAYVTIGATRADDGLEVTVRDLGKGFDPDNLREGFGIRESIRGRLCMVGGSARVESTPGSGTAIHLWVAAAHPGSQPLAADSDLIVPRMRQYRTAVFGRDLV